MNLTLWKEEAPKEEPYEEQPYEEQPDEEENNDDSTTKPCGGWYEDDDK